MKFFITSTVAFYFTITLIKCYNYNFGSDSDSDTSTSESEVSTSNIQNIQWNKKRGMIGKALLDLKYKHRNASFIGVQLGIEDIYRKLTRIEGYNVDAFRDMWIPTQVQSRYIKGVIRKRHRIAHWPKVRDSLIQERTMKRSPLFQLMRQHQTLNKTEVRCNHHHHHHKHNGREGNEGHDGNDGHEANGEVASGDCHSSCEEGKHADSKENSKEREKKGMDDRRESSEYNTYFTPYMLHEQMKNVIKHFPNLNITMETIGRTESFNDILMLKISPTRDNITQGLRTADEKYADERDVRKVIFIVHGLSVMGYNKVPCLSDEKYFTKLLELYLAHLDKFDFFVVPMANPDGASKLTYSPLNLEDALWNKNIAPQRACSGVAVDRNFDVAWNRSTRISSCSQQYPGHHPFSERESQAIKRILHRNSNKIQAYIHVHAGSYTAEVFKGDAVLYPKGYSDVTMDDDKYVDIKSAIDTEIRNADFQVLQVYVDTLHSWYGYVTGSSVDYACSVYGVPYGLEFVMQIYTDDADVDDSGEKETNVVLREVWGRIINVTFDNINKNMLGIDPNVDPYVY